MNAPSLGANVKGASQIPEPVQEGTRPTCSAEQSTGQMGTYTCAHAYSKAPCGLADTRRKEGEESTACTRNARAPAHTNTHTCLPEVDLDGRSDVSRRLERSLRVHLQHVLDLVRPCHHRLQHAPMPLGTRDGRVDENGACARVAHERPYRSVHMRQLPPIPRHTHP